MQWNMVNIPGICDSWERDCQILAAHVCLRSHEDKPDEITIQLWKLQIIGLTINCLLILQYASLRELKRRRKGYEKFYTWMLCTAGLLRIFNWLSMSNSSLPESFLPSPPWKMDAAFAMKSSMRSCRNFSPCTAIRYA